MDKILRIARRSYRVLQEMVARSSITGFKTPVESPVEADEFRKRCGDVLVHSKRLINVLQLLKPIIVRYGIRLKADPCNTGTVEECLSFGFDQKGENTCLFIAMSPFTPFQHSFVIGFFDSIEQPMRDIAIVYDAVQDKWSVDGKHALAKPHVRRGQPTPIEASMALRLIEGMVALSASEQALPTRPARVSLQ